MLKKVLTGMSAMFLIPVILLSIFLWQDYTSTLDDTKPKLDRVYGIYYFGPDDRLAVLAESSEGFNAVIFDDQQKIVKEIELRSDIHRQVAAAYQQGKLVFVTNHTGEAFQIYAVDSSGESEELTGGKLKLPSFLSSNVYEWRGRLLITGKVEDSTLTFSQLHNGQLRSVPLVAGDYLPARATRVSMVSGSFSDKYPIPMLELNLKNDTAGYASALLDKNNRLQVALRREDDRNSFEAEKRAAEQFAQHFGVSTERLLKVSGDYPKQTYYYNAGTDQMGELLKTPKPVYQAHIYMLNDTESLVIGSTTEDELDGSLIGYVYDEKTEALKDITNLLPELVYNDLEHDKLMFFKENDSDKLYYTLKEKSAGVLSTATGTVGTVTSDAIKSWDTSTAASQVSLHTFWHHLMAFNAITINWMIWVLISAILILVIPVSVMVVRLNRRRQLAEGVVLQGTVVAISETGLYINNRPQLKYRIRFEDEGQITEVYVAKVTSYLDSLKIGSLVKISYNRRKHKALFIDTN